MFEYTLEATNIKKMSDAPSKFEHITSRHVSISLMNGIINKKTSQNAYNNIHTCLSVLYVCTSVCLLYAYIIMFYQNKIGLISIGS